VEARRAEAEDEVPIGAIVVLDGQVIGRGHNQTRTRRDPTAHAEMLAIAEAARTVGRAGTRAPGDVNLNDAVLKVEAGDNRKPVFARAGFLRDAHRFAPLMLSRRDNGIVRLQAFRGVQPDGCLRHRGCGNHDADRDAARQRPDRTQTARFVRNILTMFEGQTMSVDEGYIIYSAVHSSAKVEGDLAEVGVFRGQSARIICEAKGDKTLHLFDTFQGLPTPAPIDSAFKEGQLEK
jgi:hypothetical protein